MSIAGLTLQEKEMAFILIFFFSRMSKDRVILTKPKRTQSCET